MKSPVLQTTSDYSLFEIDPHNRSIRNVRKLIHSLKKHGFLPAHPIAVVRRGKKLIIKDGQHRLEAAKAIGIPVYYVESAAYESASIPGINSAGAGAWNLKDYIGSFCNQSNEDFITLKSFMDETRLPAQIAASLLIGNSGASANAGPLVKSGTFKVRDLAFAYNVAAVVNTAREYVTWSTNTYFVDAVSKAIRVPGCSHKDLAAKIHKRPGSLKHYGDCDGFLTMLEEIFNHASRTPIPLKFNAQKLARERSAAVSKALTPAT